ncbi:hypothetical protein ACLMJK_005813 [Lecanora helva]
MDPAKFLRPPQADLHVESNEQLYCTYISPSSSSNNTTPRHSLETYGHCLAGEAEGYSYIDNRSLFSSCNKDGTNGILAPFSSTLTCLPVKSPAISNHCQQRSLTDAATLYYNEMTAFVTAAPGSPPGLSGSKSSKSSSFHSSSHSGKEAILSDITHFEDIGLEEDPHPLGLQNLHGMDKSLRPLPHPANTNGSRRSSANMELKRELTDASNKPHALWLQPPKGHNAAQSLSLPNGMGPPTKRGFRSPSTPSLAIKAMSNRNRSRSPSPNTISPLHKPMRSPVSPKRPGLSSSSTSVKSLPVRRGSWQPSRKSIKEIEAEYDDLDEDLPEDASLWNVPLSPRPPTERTPISPSISPKASPRTSPERPSSIIANGAPNSKAPMTAPVLSARSPLSQSLNSPSSSPRKPRPPLRGSSTSTLPDSFGFPVGRTKSWNIALAELSEEAKSLTEALENQAVISEQKHEEAVQNGEGTTRPSMEKLSRSKTSTVELPPLRMNNVMIDPLPVSKEKEKVLSRTRPSWLPPKSQKEERKHLKEYQRMMEFSLEAERRKAAKVVDSQCAKDDTKSALLRIWEEHVLPNWDQVIREPRTRELWWRGVAPKSRAKVWQKAIGNELALTETTFAKALQRAKDTEARASRSSSEGPSKEKVWFDAIRRDVKATFLELHIFQPGGPLHNDLVDVLMAYSMYRSDVGYSHGTHLIAGLLRLQLNTPSDTFSTLANLLNRPIPLAFLTGDPTATAKAYQLTDGLLSHKYPRLHTHLFSPAPNGLGLTAHAVFEPMMRTLFLGPGDGLGVDRASRVWDVMVFDGDGVIIRTAVAVLSALEGKLYGSAEEVLGVLGWNGGCGKGSWDVGTEEEFLGKVRAAGKEGKERK